MNNVYSKAYTEVLEIINHFSENEYKKYQEKKLIFMKKNAILVSLFRDYFATDRQKEILKNLLQQNQEKIEVEKYQKYNPNNIFNNKIYRDESNHLKEELALVDIKKQAWYRKILDFFKSGFKKSKKGALNLDPLFCCLQCNKI